MERRAFLKGGAAGLAATTVAVAAAQAQAGPEVKWRIAATHGKNLDALWGGTELFCKIVADATDNRFQIRAFAGGEIVPGFQILDAVQNQTIEAGHSATYFYVGKDPTFAFETAVPFGMNTRQHLAWMFQGGGIEALAPLYKEYGILSFPFGNTGAQMGGWYRKEIKTVDDLKGLKMRIGGFAGQVIARLGVVAQQLPPGDIYPALEKGAIDAAEWVGPYDDEKLGFYKAAPYYYYPGWWEGTACGSLFINQKAWDALPPNYQAIVKAASLEVSNHILTRYDAYNPAALRKLVAGGTQLRPFPRPIMEAAYKAAHEHYAETAAKNPRFKAVYESWKKFRDEEILWFRVCELTFDNFMAAQTGKA